VYSTIIATIGPQSSSLETLRDLIRAGVNCCRLNFSHGDGESLAPIAQRIRQAAREEERQVAILADIQGPKLRIGKLPEEGIELAVGDAFRLVAEPSMGDQHRVHCRYPHLAKDVEPKTRVLLSDGALELEVERIEGEDVLCRVRVAGRLTSNKGLNLPGRRLTIETLTEKDVRDLEFIAKTDIDLVAVSFVRSPDDLHAARRVLGSARHIPLVAKLERPEALACLDEILAAADGVMVARGDLGVELPFEQVPVLQKRILARAAAHGVWAVVATQMLGSMTHTPRPSRAEASDVVNAVLDGTDAVMLSEETATGHDPVAAVRAMAELCVAGEAFEASQRDVDVAMHSFAAGSASAAVRAARQLNARAIVTLAGSEHSARLVSKCRPRFPVVALATDAASCRRLHLLRGTWSVQAKADADLEAQLRIADRWLLQRGWAREGEVVVMVAALPLGTATETNTMRFHRVRA
jgi:pyruvate kinase